MTARTPRLALLLVGLAVAPGCKLFQKKPPENPVTAAAAAPSPDAPDGTAVVAPEWTPERVDKKINEAAALLTTGQESHAREALEILRVVGKEAPDKAEIPYNEGVAYQILGDGTAARKSYLRATQINPRLGEAWLNLGAMAEREGDYNRALSNYEAGFDNAPENPELIVGIIGVLRKLGRHDEAIARAKEAVQKNANNINAYNNLGLVYMDQGKLDLALFIYQRALQFIDGADNNALLHTNLGRIYLAQDQAGAARTEFERALQADPNQVAAMMFLAQVSMDRRDWDETVRLLEKARSLEPDNAAISQNLGIAYRGQGRFEDAKRAYERALDLAPDNPDPYLNLAVLLGDHMKAYDQAVDELETYKRQGGTRVDLADAWITDIKDQQDKAQRAEERKRKQEEARKKKEERERLIREAEEREAREAEEAARRAAEEAAAPPTPAPEGGAEPPPDEEGAAPDVPVEAGAGTDPWGGGGTSAPPESAPLPMESAPPQETPAPSVSGVGNDCSGMGTCGDWSLECAHDGVCRDSSSPGTYGLGVGCMQDEDCAFGLVCMSNICSNAPGQAPAAGTDSPWGGP